MAVEYDQESLLGAQAAFGLAALMIQNEPGQEWVRTCAEDDLFDAAPFGMDDPAVIDGLKLLSSWCATAGEDVSQSTGDIQRDWLRLFIGAGVPEAPVWEAYYTEPNATTFGRSTLEVRKAYRAWGLEFERKGHEPDDSLGLMLAFCSHLMGCEIAAVESGDQEAAEKAVSALEAFMVKHMLPWASAWRYLMGAHAKTDYYRGVGELVFGLMRAYARRFGVECNPEDGTFSYSAR